MFTTTTSEPVLSKIPVVESLKEFNKVATDYGTGFSDYECFTKELTEPLVLPEGKTVFDVFKVCFDDGSLLLEQYHKERNDTDQKYELWHPAGNGSPSFSGQRLFTCTTIIKAVMAKACVFTEYQRYAFMNVGGNTPTLVVHFSGQAVGVMFADSFRAEALMTFTQTDSTVTMRSFGYIQFLRDVWVKGKITRTSLDVEMPDCYRKLGNLLIQRLNGHVKESESLTVKEEYPTLVQECSQSAEKEADSHVLLPKPLIYAVEKAMRGEKLVTEASSSSFLEQQKLMNGSSGFGGGSVSNDGTYYMGDVGYGMLTPTPPTSSFRRTRSQIVSSGYGTDEKGSTDWAQSPSYRSYRSASRIRRHRGDDYSSRHSQRNGYVRTYSSRGVTTRAEDEGNMDCKDLESLTTNGSEVFGRRSSLPDTYLDNRYGSSYSGAQTSRSEYQYRNNANNTVSAVHDTGNSRIDIPVHLTPAFSDDQKIRVRTCLNSSSPSKNAAKIKALEFFHFWLSDETTPAPVEQIIKDVYGKAGIVSPKRDIINEKVKNTDVQMTISSLVGTPFLNTTNNQAKLIETNMTPPSSCSSTTFSGNNNTDQVDRPSKDGNAHDIALKQTLRSPMRSENSSPGSLSNELLNRSPPPKTPIRTATSTPKATKPRTSLGSTTENASLKQQSVLVTATYEDIPRFYYPHGMPTLEEESLVGQRSKSLENPHLKMVKGIVLPAAVYDAQEDKGAVMRGKVPTGRKAKSIPIAPLKAMDDKEVVQYIQREFSRLPAVPKLSRDGRTYSSLDRRLIGTNNNQIYNRHGNYKQQLIHTIQRICTQCLGIPKYFAFLILRFMQTETDRGFAGAKPSRGETSLSVSSGSVVPVSSVTVTAQNLQEFFEKYLRGRSILRRMFDIFQLSSLLVSTKTSGTDSVTNNSTTPDKIEEEFQIRPFLLPEDFRIYIGILLDHHPGLDFLKGSSDFQVKYLDTVVYRIFYDLDRFDRGRITYPEFENSRLPDALRHVDATDDINSVLLYFSYEHFYVLYCRFWELDEDHDKLISREDFLRYAPEDLLNPLIADRVFSGVGRKLTCTVKDRINYEDFVWFCLSEEDKSTPTAIRYWFRILDLDGDGVLSAFELQTFYVTTRSKVLKYVPDGSATFEDVICQIFDLFGVKACCGLRLADFLSNPEVSYVALNMVTNVVRFLLFEQRDPLVAHQERLQGGVEQTPWDRFARCEYDRMSQEVADE